MRANGKAIVGVALVAAVVAAAVRLGRADDRVPPAAAPAALKTQALDYKDGETLCKGWLAYDPAASGPRPAVLVVHDWFGQGEFARQTAERVARWGYVGLAVDMYGDGKVTKDPKEAGQLSGQFHGEGRAKGRARIKAALAALEPLAFVDHAKSACLGFCFGGTVSLELAWSGAPIKAAVSFHGHPTAPAESDSWTADLLVLHGADDPYVPAQMLTDFQTAVRAKKGEFEIDVYSGAVHAFAVPGVDAYGLEGARYNRRAAERAFSRCEAFLREAFAR